MATNVTDTLPVVGEIPDHSYLYHSYHTFADGSDLLGNQYGLRLACGLLLLCLLTYVSTTIRFWAYLGDIKGRNVPVVPYWVPGIFHALALWDPARFIFSLRQYGSRKPLQVKAGWFRFFILSNPDHVKSLFRQSRQTINTGPVAFTLRTLLELPLETVQLYLADKSGAGIVPRKDSDVPPERRITFLVSHNMHKYLSGRFLEGASQRYASMLRSRVAEMTITQEWVEMPDLFDFMQRTILIPQIQALFGMTILNEYAGFIDDLLVFTKHVPDVLRLRPRWLIPEAYRARRRLIDSLKRWHTAAESQVGFRDVSEQDPEWEPVWGSRLLRVRQQYEHKTGSMNAEARACEDVGLIWAATTNVQGLVFWLVYEALRDPNLKGRLLHEVDECRTTDAASGTTSLDVAKLTAQPLMQSTYAEVLRLYVGVASSRVSGYGDMEIDGYVIPKDSLILTYSRVMALDTAAWERAGRTLTKPLDEFDAERFLVSPTWSAPGRASRAPTDAEESQGGDDRRFSTDGLLGLWVPYGGGDHMCPGRHLAKQQMMVTFATLLSEFDVELALGAARSVSPDLRFAPFGSLPPAGPAAFRVRRKAAKAPSVC